MEPVTISVRQLLTRVRNQPLAEKLFFWGAVVYTSATVLPWIGSEAVHRNGWDLGLLVGLANLVMVAGLVVQVGGLAGIGPGATSTRWLAYYRYALILPPVAVLYCLLLAGARGLGAWMALVALAVALQGMYQILLARGLLPFRITR
jgi:hypothetical protein